MKITILMHEHDLSIDRYIISALAEVWRSQGHQVEEQRGVSRPVAGDVVFLHVDLTVIPPAYLRAVAGHPCVINGRVVDISKTLISRFQVHSPEEWDGPVIVKTVRNHGGHPERQVRRHTPLGRTLNLLDKASRIRLGWARYLDPRSYPMFDSARDVPRSVFRNPHLMVERFLPERRGDLYVTRHCRFLGNRCMCELVTCRDLHVGTRTTVEKFRIEVHDEIMALAREMGLGYGKLDYVIHDGRPILLDANRTPELTSLEAKREVAKLIAPGLAGLVR